NARNVARCSSSCGMHGVRPETVFENRGSPPAVMSGTFEKHWLHCCRRYSTMTPGGKTCWRHMRRTWWTYNVQSPDTKLKADIPSGETDGARRACAVLPN